MRWQWDGSQPPNGKYVLIAVPHTSNWDLPPALAIFWAAGINIKFLAKSSLFWFPLGPLLRWLGGIPVTRDRRSDMVAQVATYVGGHPGPLGVAVAAEGTRAYADYWKSGFYNIARTADVPIVFGYLDFAHRRGGFGPAIKATTPSEVMDAARAYYADKVAFAKHPAQVGPIRLRDESPTVAASPTIPA